jgi:hypothetical protein
LTVDFRRVFTLDYQLFDAAAIVSHESTFIELIGDVLAKRKAGATINEEFVEFGNVSEREGSH